MLNPRFPAPVNTYNPTIHALVDAIYEALAHIQPERTRADGSGSRSIIIGGRTTTTGKGYVQYEIIGGGAGARPSKDGASGTCMNQSNAKIAPVEIIESEFATRMLRFELIRDSGGPGFYRGGLGIRREYLNLADARFSIRSTKHIVPANGLAGGNPGRTGDILINPERDGREAPADPLRRLSAQGRRRVPPRYAGRRRLCRCAGRASPARCWTTCARAWCRAEAAEKQYGVVLKKNGTGLGRSTRPRRRHGGWR